MSLKSTIARCALMASLIATLSPSAHALLDTSAESLSGYAGIATLTVTRAGPTSSSTASGSASGVSGTTVFSLAWQAGDGTYASSVGTPGGLPLYAVDFGTVLPGSAPTSLGTHVFDLSRPTTALDLGDLDLGGPSGGELDEVLALIDDADARAAWTDHASQGIFSARYQLILFDASARRLAAGEIPTAQDAAINAVPEPGVVALIGIALVAVGLSLRPR